MVDGLRLLAALMVVGFHFVALGPWKAPVGEVFPTLHLPAAYGWLGVQLFFLISGFVICMSCWGRSVGQFFVSRVARLYPAYIFAVLATTAVLFLVPGGTEPKAIKDLLANLTMLQQPIGAPNVDAVYWTLWAELRFYLLFAIIVWRGLTYRRVVTFCFVWAAAVLFVNRFDSAPLKDLLMPEYCWYFIAGITFYLMYRFGPNLLLTGMVVGCFLAAQRLTLNIHARAEKNTGFEFPELPTILLVALFFIIMALVATRRLTWIRGRWLTVAGALTYPLYLLHEYIGWEIIILLENRVPALLLVSAIVVAMLLAAWLVHRLIERPGARWVRTRLTRALVEVVEATSAGSRNGGPGTYRAQPHPVDATPELPALAPEQAATARRH